MMTAPTCSLHPWASQTHQKTLQASLDQLPERVADMREKILAAAESGDINALRPAIERNEVMPLFGKPGARAHKFSQAVEFLKAQSFDGEGREILSLLAAILNAPYKLLKKKPIDIYVWPSFAADEKAAASTAVANLYQFSAFADLGKSTASGLPLMHRVEIGADGTWHFFAVE